MLLLLFSLLPLAVSNIRGYMRSRELLVERGARDLRTVTELQAAQVLRVIGERKDLMRFLVQDDPRLVGLMQDVQDVSVVRGQLRLEIVAVLARKMRERKRLEGLAVYGVDGAQLGASGQCTGLPVQFGKGVFRPRIEQAEGEPRILLGLTIRDPKGRTVGSAIARMRFAIRKQLMAARDQRVPGGSIYLLDGSGKVVCCAHDGAHGPQLPILRLVLSAVPSRARPWHGMLASRSAEVFGAYAPVGKSDWGVAAQQHPSRVSLPLDALKRQALIFAGALAVLLLAVGYWTARTVSGPIRTLTQSARRMAGGARGETVQITGPAELEDLASSFNQMSLALERYETSLEAQIRHRTDALEESRAFSDRLLSSIDQPMILLDQDSSIIKANAAGMRNHGDGLVGALCRDVMCRGETGCPSCAVGTAFKTGKIGSGEMALYIGDRHEVCKVMTYPISGESGDVEQLVLTYQVVTEEKRQQAQMINQEKLAAVGLLAAGIAHEIGNPLASMSAQIQHARSRPGEVDETLRILGNQVSRIDVLLRDLTQFARRRKDEYTVVSVGQVVEDVARLIEHDPRSSRVQIERDLTLNLPGVETREDQLLQVLLNLGINGLDAIEGAGFVRFSSTLECGQVVIRVSDNGGGIPAEHRDRIFEPFFTTKPIDRGTGLGLFVNQQIIAELGGSLELGRTGPDGTTFIVRIPAHQVEPLELTA